MQHVGKYLVALAVSLVLHAVFVAVADAATLSLSPATGVYASGNTFTARVVVQPQGKSVNAAEGTLAFNPNELAVVSVNRTGSIFNLWVTEPTFSNSAGTISFSGGVPSGYSGNSGTVMNIIFRAVGAGTAKVNFKNGSVLANDGRGTNILTSMGGGTYTIQAKSEAPIPEVIEYVAPANTPGKPVISSKTHPDPDGWYANNKAELTWTLPSGITAIRTLLDDVSSSVPTKVYDNPVSSITLSDLDEGVQYFHLQFKNEDGWGVINHYRLAVDTRPPTSIVIKHPEGANLANPIQTLVVEVKDDLSPVNRFMISVDGADKYEYIDKTGSSTIELPSLEPGHHTIVIEAYDAAGNFIVGTHAFMLESFDRPEFTEYPTEITPEVIPVIKGQTRSNASVEVSLSRVGSDAVLYTISSDAAGEFVFIPEGRFETGVYELTAVATDEFGARSEVSDAIRIAVQQSGYLRIGSFLVSVLSVIVPLIVLLFALIFGVWYLFMYARRFRRRVRVESTEAMQILRREFGDLQMTLRQQESALQQSRKTKKLTKAEAAMIEVFDRALQQSQMKVEKEIEDVTDLTRKQE